MTSEAIEFDQKQELLSSCLAKLDLRKADNVLFYSSSLKKLLCCYYGQFYSVDIGSERQPIEVDNHAHLTHVVFEKKLHFQLEDQDLILLRDGTFQRYKSFRVCGDGTVLVFNNKGVEYTLNFKDIVKVWQCNPTKFSFETMIQIRHSLSDDLKTKDIFQITESPDTLKFAETKPFRQKFDNWTLFLDAPSNTSMLMINDCLFTVKFGAEMTQVTQVHDLKLTHRLMQLPETDTIETNHMILHDSKIYIVETISVNAKGQCFLKTTGGKVIPFDSENVQRVWKARYSDNMLETDPKALIRLHNGTDKKYHTLLKEGVLWTRVLSSPPKKDLNANKLKISLNNEQSSDENAKSFDAVYNAITFYDTATIEEIFDVLREEIGTNADSIDTRIYIRFYDQSCTTYWTLGYLIEFSQKTAYNSVVQDMHSKMLQDYAKLCKIEIECCSQEKKSVYYSCVIRCNQEQRYDSVYNLLSCNFITIAEIFDMMRVKTRPHFDALDTRIIIKYYDKKQHWTCPASYSFYAGYNSAMEDLHKKMQTDFANLEKIVVQSLSGSDPKSIYYSCVIRCNQLNEK